LWRLTLGQELGTGEPEHGGAGVDLNDVDQHGNRPTCVAASLGNKRVLSALIRYTNARGSSCHVQDRFLYRLGSSYDLCRSGADATARDGRNYTPFMHACQAGHTNVVQLLMTLHTSSHRQDKTPEGFTALMLAVKHRQAEVVDMLLAANLDPNVRNTAGQSCLDLARANKDAEMESRLVAAGAE
jgi:ankyrin repeat protein